ncbi:hypothetical protein E1264_20735 [Actinomadura sp. KC216]|uniref:hypothetical protein n=1 Tax=Actinomadura sp. KC216 TaxID=2530370 RepID=UPI00104E6B0A|nr:hypothetical protein [Actinomadura sp. KC216]TDB85563.1 hypothetical protein E1264_20735 [Actinomadura sp. KC216]
MTPATAVLTAPAASAAPAPVAAPAPQTTEAFSAAARWRLTVGLAVDQRRNRYAAAARMKDLTSGRDRVCVRVYVQRKHRSGWRRVTPLPKKCGWDSVTVKLPTRSCVNGKYYRAVAQGWWHNRLVAVAKTRGIKC